MNNTPSKIKISRNKFLKSALGACSLCAAGLAAASSKVLAQTAPPANEQPQTARMGFTSPSEAAWFTNVDNSGIKCGLCPNECRLQPGQRSLCRVRENRDGKGYTLAHSNPALIQEDPVERKPFFHVLPGTRALSISTAGCNLSCKFCEVWDMALVAPEDVHAYNMPPDDIVKHARAAGLKSLSYAFGEPVIFYEYMKKTAEKAREQGLLNLMHTAAYINPDPLEELCSTVDAVNVDLKSFDEEFYREVVGGELQPVLDSLKTIREKGLHLEITTIVIPTLNDDMEMLERMCAWIKKELGPDVPLHLARFYPLYQLSGLPRTPVSTLDKARETAMQAGLNHVYVSRVTGHEGENTFCPGCKEKIINRVGFVIDSLDMQDGKCSHCGREITGIWG